MEDGAKRGWECDAKGDAKPGGDPNPGSTRGGTKEGAVEEDSHSHRVGLAHGREGGRCGEAANAGRVDGRGGYVGEVCGRKDRHIPTLYGGYDSSFGLSCKVYQREEVGHRGVPVAVSAGAGESSEGLHAGGKPQARTAEHRAK